MEKNFGRLKCEFSITSAYVQQQIIHTIRLVSTHEFEEINLDLPDVEGAGVIPLAHPPIAKIRCFGFTASVYQTIRAVVPQSSGKLIIPATAISAKIAMRCSVLELEQPFADCRKTDA